MTFRTVFERLDRIRINHHAEWLFIDCFFDSTHFPPGNCSIRRALEIMLKINLSPQKEMEMSGTEC